MRLVFEGRDLRRRHRGRCGPEPQRLTELSSQLERMQPIRRSEVQRVLGRMRELPGLSLVANTRRDEAESNGYALAVNAAFDPVDGAVGVSNRGTEEIGPFFVNGQVVANGWLTGLEKIGVVATAATEDGKYSVSAHSSTHRSIRAARAPSCSPSARAPSRATMRPTMSICASGRHCGSHTANGRRTREPLARRRLRCR